MQTKREALAAQGLAIAGARGKFSKAANAWLVEQRAVGVKFSDDDAPVKSVKAPASKEEKADKPTGVGYPDYIFPSDFRFPEGEYKAFRREGGKKVSVGMREVCSNCHVSLVNHGCEKPVIYGNVPVTIEKG